MNERPRIPYAGSTHTPRPRGAVNMYITLAPDLHAELKRIAAENFRSLSAECALRLASSLKKEKQP